MPVGYNPAPGSPDPFRIALELGYSKDPEGWDIGLAHQAARAAGDMRIDEAHVARYGVPWTQWGKFGAELELTHWPAALQILGDHGVFGQPGGKVSLREAHDATHFGPWNLLRQAFALDNREGWSIANPMRVSRADLPPGPFTEKTSLFGGSLLYYFNTAGTVIPPAPTTPPATPPASGELEKLKTQLARAEANLDEALTRLEAIQEGASTALEKLPKTGGGAPARIGREFCKWVLEQ